MSVLPFMQTNIDIYTSKDLRRVKKYLLLSSGEIYIILDYLSLLNGLSNT